MTQARHCRLCFEACSVYYTLLDPKGNNNKKFQILQNYFEEKFLNAERRRNLTVVCLNCWQPVCDFNKFKESLLLLDATFDEAQTIKLLKKEEKLPDDLKLHIKKEPDENHPPNDQQKPQVVDENSNNEYSKESLITKLTSVPLYEEDSSLLDESLEDFEISLSDAKKEPNENQSGKDLNNSKAMKSKQTAKSKESNVANNISMQSLDLDESLEDFEFSFCNDAPVKVEKIDNDDKKNVALQMISIPAEKENLKLLEDSLEDFNISLCDVKNEANENQPPNLHLDTPQTETKSVAKNSTDHKTPSGPQTLSQNPNEMNQSVDDFDISFTELESIDIQFSSDDDASLPDSVDTARSESQMKYDDNISERLKVRHNWDKCHLEALRQRLEEADDDDKPSLRIEIEKVMDAIRERRRRHRKNNRRNRTLKRLKEKKRRRHYD
ncbi:uncharacterized protein LOC105261698 [Musca domestica]|uniref:Uncharacterized protein LOC105261698 n=1 Tax=Musca domestica TaxID=7370 RepID=A0ABM3UNC8_MUSDO|nr:uncharacterized protein LOC105261698 [Musca domestica]XP_058975019.1 uncharacterized protein LOC105261698 [Musca domestica]